MATRTARGSGDETKDDKTGVHQAWGKCAVGCHLRELLRRHSHRCGHLCSLGWIHSLEHLSHLGRAIRLASSPADTRRHPMGDVGYLVPIPSNHRLIVIIHALYGC